MVRFEALMLLFRTMHGAFRSIDAALSHHAWCVLEALMLLFRSMHGAFRSADGAISHHARCVSKHECSVSRSAGASRLSSAESQITPLRALRGRLSVCALGRSLLWHNDINARSNGCYNYAVTA